MVTVGALTGFLLMSALSSKKPTPPASEALHITCVSKDKQDKTVEECLRSYEENLNKLNCVFKRLSCETPNPTGNLSNNNSAELTCKYDSKNCYDYSEETKCARHFVARVLTGSEKIICVKPPDTSPPKTPFSKTKFYINSEKKLRNLFNKPKSGESTK